MQKKGNAWWNLGLNYNRPRPRDTICILGVTKIPFLGLFREEILLELHELKCFHLNMGMGRIDSPSVFLISIE